MKEKSMKETRVLTGVAALIGLCLLCGCRTTEENAARPSSSARGMVLIPAGTNGGTDPDFGAYNLTVSTFYMDRTEVTKAQWDQVRTWGLTNGYTDLALGSWSSGQYYKKGPNHPVHSVTWYDCVKWCNARSQKAGREPVYYTDAGFTQIYKTGNVLEPFVKTSANGYRLPTDTEWEYAARGGVSSKRYPWGGDTINHAYANYSANGNEYAYDISPYTHYTDHPDYNDGHDPHTSPVGVFESGRNAYGLYDMAGNVSEWCYDWYPESEGSHRVIRGGCWSGGAEYCRVGFPVGYAPDNGGDRDGFRAVLPPGQ